MSNQDLASTSLSLIDDSFDDAAKSPQDDEPSAVYTIVSGWLGTSTAKSVLTVHSATGRGATDGRLFPSEKAARLAALTEALDNCEPGEDVAILFMVGEITTSDAKIPVKISGEHQILFYTVKTIEMEPDVKSDDLP
jgi:hypothetical protein